MENSDSTLVVIGCSSQPTLTLIKVIKVISQWLKQVVRELTCSSSMTVTCHAISVTSHLVEASKSNFWRASERGVWCIYRGVRMLIAVWRISNKYTSFIIISRLAAQLKAGCDILNVLGPEKFIILDKQLFEV